MNTHPTPWRLEPTSRGESMGYDTMARIVDANGCHVVTVGHGSNVRAESEAEEALAALIVAAVNAYQKA